jgi:hypothetical protein
VGDVWSTLHPTRNSSAATVATRMAPSNCTLLHHLAPAPSSQRAMGRFGPRTARGSAVS